MDANVIIYLMFGGLSFFVLFLFIYILKRDRVIEQKFGALELALEDINKELFELKKKDKNKSLIGAIERLEEIMDTLVDDMRALEERNKAFYMEIQEELAKLKIDLKKDKIQNITNIGELDRERILTLYKNGYSIEEISRELRIPAGEVDLIVKFSSF
ncbi:MAG: hypothetical protein ABGX25_02030 [Nautiliaceae bacterium]